MKVLGSTHLEKIKFEISEIYLSVYEDVSECDVNRLFFLLK